MPMFTKMGLNGKGNMGKKESYLRSARKRAARRKVMDGFPILSAFQSLEEVREYLGGDKIVCLQCGRCFRRLAMHLPKIHGMTLDQYRELYNIPWSYALGCEEYRAIVAHNLQRHIDDGATWFVGHPDIANRKHVERRQSPFASDVARVNLGEHLGSVKHKTDGKKEERKAAARSRRNSPEHRAKLSETQKGIPKSDAHKAAVSAGQRKRWALRKANQTESNQ